MKKKKIISLIMAALMVMSVVACGTSEESTSSEEIVSSEEVASTEETASETVSYEGQTLKVAVRANPATAVCFENICKAFEEAYGVTVEFAADAKMDENLRLQLVAGEYPDVYINQSNNDTMFVSMSNEKKLIDLTDVFEGNCYDDETISLRDRMANESYLSGSNCDLYDDGHVYAAPFGYKTKGVLYNKALMDKYGWELPTTFDEFMELGEKAKAEGIALMTYQGIYPAYMECLLWGSLASVLGPDKVSELSRFEEGIITSEPAVEVLEKIAEVAEKGYLLEGTVGLDHTQAQTEFMKGNALFITGGDSVPSEMADVEPCEDFEWAMTPSFTMTEEQTQYGLSMPLLMCMFEGAENVDLGKEFIRFMYTDEVAEILSRDGSILANVKNSATIGESYFSEGFMNIHEIDDQFEWIEFRWASLPEGSRVVLNDEVWAPLSEVMNGKMSAAEWAQNIEDALHAINSGE